MVWCNVVYDEEYLEQKKIGEEELSAQFSKDLSVINDTLPSYKYINHFIMTDTPMIKTTTQKIKRNPAIKAIDENWEEIKKYNVEP